MTRKEAFFHGILLALGVYQLQTFLFGQNQKTGTHLDMQNFNRDFQHISDDVDRAAGKFVMHLEAPKQKKAASC